MATLLQKFVDADQWEAEDTAARLGLLMHAAFLAAGFHPYGAKPAASGHLLQRAGEAGSRCLSRQYTAPQLSHREGADAAVLMLCAQGGHVALLVFLTSDRHLRGVYRELVDVAAVAPLLSRALGDAEPWASRICWRLADGLCWGLFVKLCRRNGLPLTGFMSMPDDIKVEILRRLADGKDLARVECTCTQLRRLVAERDGELWKPLYNDLSVRRRSSRRWVSLFLDPEDEDEDEEEISWKGKYVGARPRPSWSRMWQRLLWDSFPVIDYSSFLDDDYSCVLDALRDPPEEEETTVSTWSEGTGVRRRKVARNEFKKKRDGSGAIHSPSSRYRWKHR